MPRIALAAPVLATLALVALAPPAEATQYYSAQPCTLSSSNDVTGLVNQIQTWQYGQISGRAITGVGVQARLHCWVQLVPGYATAAPYAGGKVEAETEGTGTTVVEAPAAVVYFDRHVFDADVYVCASVSTATGTTLWDAGAPDPVTGQPGAYVPASRAASAQCQLAIATDLPNNPWA